MSATVAALYVDPNGAYANLPGVEVWDEARDARLYAGPWPVVAHPPCNRWCMLAPLNEAQYGHKIGDDDGMFLAALCAVRQHGGVLEHPAGSYAWSHFNLPKPQRWGWYRNLFDPGWVTEVSQGAYGHPARKRTWLYYIGRTEPPLLDWHEPPSVRRVSDLGPGGTRKRGDDWEPGVQYAEASVTPPAFRDVLLQMARSAAQVPA